MIGFKARRQNIGGNQKIITFTDNYTHVAFQNPGFRRKEKKLKSLLKGSLAVLKSFRLQRGQRKTSSNINGIRDQILSQTPTETITKNYRK